MKLFTADDHDDVTGLTMLELIGEMIDRRDPLLILAEEMLAQRKQLPASTEGLGIASRERILADMLDGGLFGALHGLHVKGYERNGVHWVAIGYNDDDTPEKQAATAMHEQMARKFYEMAQRILLLGDNIDDPDIHHALGDLYGTAKAQITEIQGFLGYDTTAELTSAELTSAELTELESDSPAWMDILGLTAE